MPRTYAQYLTELADRSRAFDRLASHPPTPGHPVHAHSLSGSARPLAAARLRDRLHRPVLIVAPDAETAENWYEDLLFFGAPALAHFPMAETLPYEAEEPVIEIVARQYETLYLLARKDDPARVRGTAGTLPPPLIVTPIEALHRKVPSPREFDQLVLTFEWGARVEPETLAERLVDFGYRRVGMTEARGEFSIRGHIVDIFPPQLENPVRLDLFDDEIESMRFFDVATQRSIMDAEELERIVILPASIQAIALSLARMTGGDSPPLVALDRWLPDDTIAFLDSPEKFDPMLEQIERITQQRFEELTVAGKAPATPEFIEPRPDTPLSPISAEFRRPPEPAALFQTHSEIHATLDRFGQVLLHRLDIRQAPGAEGAPAAIDFGVSSYEEIPPDLDAYIALFKRRQAQDFSIHIICDNDGQVHRLVELLAENEIAGRALPENDERARDFKPHDLLEGYQEITVATGLMHTGFIYPEAQLLIVTDREMFGRYKRRHVTRKAYKGKPIQSVADIQRGDFVVHSDHGIGRFIGVRRQLIEGQETELLEIEYDGGDKLLVPIEKVRHVQKYTSVEGAAPAIDRLGGKRWQTRKRKSQEKIEQMARELLELYARREAAEGYAFGPDTVWMEEFEESFLHTETPDQLRAIREVKTDMTGRKPMDRLLCGDVGFGKTEVAMRAAFKCVEEGKQAAVLVPTTILAQQHYSTFRERFAEYPYRIEQLSRFRTASEQALVTQGLKRGEVHVVIGTHRLLSNDVTYADLGLLIIDEEHRFGVAQKEKIKSLRASVDILSLSATPIPRTLHLALSGLRDMSTINTPPRDRLPVRTQVINFSPEHIEAAIMRELNRGGQIYFVHNRVQSIERVAQRIQEIVPNARVAVGHGQMHERELEQVMFDFIDRKYDVLLATTIIESGLDIPNVNTIIINRADAFGLAQLYQLRGRVGRDVRRAYAYLIVPDGRPITDDAVKRLRAIEEFTELGSGFQVAMRDLEIRGTGNILGAEQHGAIEAVGFEFYCQLLEEAVQNLRGRGYATELAVEIKWSVPAYLPAEYMPVESQRVAFYKRCGAAREPEALEELAAELRDRYGKIPPPARNLLAVSLLRMWAQRVQAERIVAMKGGFKIAPRGDLFDFLRRAQALQDTLDWIVEISATADGAVAFGIDRWNQEEGLERAIEIVKNLAG